MKARQASDDDRIGAIGVLTTIQPAGKHEEPGKRSSPMRKRLTIILFMIGISLVMGTLAEEELLAQTGKMGEERPVMEMSITGEIAKSEHGYVIRGKVPAEVFTILNADPEILDAFVKSEKTVTIVVRIVSGDNVEIESIDGKKYPKETK